jgi:hypothetical protein
MMVEAAARSVRVVVLNACYSTVQADALTRHPRESILLICRSEFDWLAIWSSRRRQRAAQRRGLGHLTR